jgi:hypothetical protein
MGPSFENAMASFLCALSFFDSIPFRREFGSKGSFGIHGIARHRGYEYGAAQIY